MDVPHFVYLFISQWTSGSFPLVTIMNNDVVDISLQVLGGHVSLAVLPYPKDWVACTTEVSILTFLEATGPK